MPLPDHFKPQDRGQKDAFDGVGGDLAANVRAGEGWLYLCVVRDGHSRRVLGWAMDSVHDTDLVERALRMAYTLRGGGADGVVFHADRGAQFTSGPHRGVLRRCDGRVVVVDAENRVLQPSTLRHPR
ncbi:DDE-type integrase/transposase/recombinase [Corynebacterium diphtheriae]|uniref:DDE-type integrase/transposase/recombinase n=1 Tax=Corynebacterium diphtheriae TaxID=1717 RepID=UPI003CC7F21C